MSPPNTISSDKLNRLIGTPAAPIVIDVRDEVDFETDPRLVPASARKTSATVTDWATDYSGKTVVALCKCGAKLSHGVAAHLRHAGANAVSLEDGFEGWKAAGLHLVPIAMLPQCDALGRTIWVTRSHQRWTALLVLG